MNAWRSGALLSCTLLLWSCTEPAARPPSPLEASFGDAAAAVLEGASFEVTPAGLSPPGLSGATRRPALLLPAHGDAPVRLSVPGALALEVRELGLSGSARVERGAVVYDAPAGRSYWTTTPLGHEEWIERFDAGDGPIAEWEISGGRLERVPDGVMVVDAQGLGRLRITAPAAFSAGGGSGRAWLETQGQRLQLYTELRGHVLVDPLWAAPVENLDFATLGATVTQLADGTLLVAGGQADLDANPTSRWNRYDPATGLWLLNPGAGSSDAGADVPLPDMPRARKNHTATRLKDGRVLVTGGQVGQFNGSATAVADVFDPTTNAWTPLAGAMTARRTQHTATLLASGRVLLAGGLSEAGTPLATTELFNPATNTFGTTGPLSVARGGHRSVLLQDGTVLAMGGSALQASAERYNPTTGQWATTGPLATGRRFFSATVLSDGRVLVAGGANAAGFLSTCEVFDPGTGQWAATGPLQVARSRHGATRLPNGHVLVAGGDGAGGALASAETYDPATGSWTAQAAMAARHGSTSVGLLPGGKALIVAGSPGTGADGGAPGQAVELFDPTDGGFLAATGGLRAARADAVTVTLASGAVLVIGGAGDGGALASVELYSHDAGTFAFTGSMLSARTRHAGTLLADGKVLVAGGQSGATVLASAEVFDPATGTWSAVGPMATARRDFTATTLPDGRVLVVGGTSGAAPLGTAEFYVPETRSWVAAPSLGSPRRGHVAELLPTGEVLVAAGTQPDGGASATPQVFQLDGGWRAGPSLGAVSAPGDLASAAVLPSGEILVAGGETAGSATNAAAVVGYPAAGGALAVTAQRMPAPRSRARAVTMPNGKVLLVGGRDVGGPVTASLLFNPEVAPGSFGASRAWETGPSLALARDGNLAALLPNSRALVAGGSADAGIRTSAQTYDEGRGALAAWTPRITSAPTTLAPGATFSIQGTLLDGLSEGGRGGVDSFSSNVPLVELRNVGSGQRVVAPVTGWSDGGVSAQLPGGAPGGYYALRLVVNGTVSDSVPVAIDPDPPLLITGAPTSLAPLAPAVTLSASGGLAGYAWSFATNASGGTFNPTTGSYRPGADGGVVDVIRVTDRRGHVATASITVTPGVTITPSSVTTGPGTTVPFAASGGSNAGFTWTLESNPSGGWVDAGVYRAGPTGDRTDVVRATDSFGNVGRATVLVGPALAITPTAPSTPPLGSVTFSASGGSGSGYAWSLQLPDGGWGAGIADGGSIGPGTGLFRAGPLGPLTQTVRVVDSVGTASTVEVQVTDMVHVSPSDATTAPLGTQDFVASGGSGTGFTWSLLSSASGGTVTPTGRFTAGTMPGTDVLQVVDSLGNRRTVTVLVTNALAITPRTQTVAPRESLQLRATGGSDAGYVWTLLTPDSGASFDVATTTYTAGTTSGAVDLVQVSDSLTAVTATLEVGPGVTATPPMATVFPRGTQAFLASGGKGTVPGDFTWTLVTNASGGTITPGGVYTAGPTGSVDDVARVTDSLGNAATVTITVTPAISITPAAPSTSPNGAINFQASGGSNGGWQWTLAAAPSGGTIDPFQGRYRAGATASVSDVVEVRDSAGNTATATVSVGGPLMITPATSTVAPLATIAFTASGGGGAPFTWRIANDNSNGTIDATGLYRAGNRGDVTDTVEVRDSANNTAQATIDVTTALSLSPLSATVPPRGRVTFTAAGGAAPLVLSLVSNASGGTFDPSTGEYTAGATGSREDEVQVADDAGAVVVARVRVTEGVTVVPDTAIAEPGQVLRFTASGGDADGGYQWTLDRNESGASIDPSTGDYTAGASSGTSDVVMATDQLGNSGVAVITVGAQPPVEPPPTPFTQRPPVSGWSCGCGAGGVDLGGVALAALALVTLRRRARRLAPVVAACAIAAAGLAPASAEAVVPKKKVAPKAPVKKAPVKAPPAEPSQPPAPEPSPAPVAAPVVAPAAAPPSPTVDTPSSLVVLDAEVSPADGQVDPTAVTEIVTASVSGAQQFKVLSSRELASMLGLERQKALLGCSDDASCMAEIANALGSDLVLTTSVARTGAAWVVSSKLIDGKRSSVAGRATLQAENANAVLAAAWQATQQALDAWGTALPAAQAERWASRPQQSPPAEVTARSEVPNFFGITALAVAGLQPLSEPGNRGSIGAEVDLTFRRGRFDLFAGVIIGRYVGARLGAGWALVDSRFRLGVGLRGTAYPELMLFGGGLGLNAEFALNRVFAITAVGAGEVYPTPQVTPQPPVVAVLGALGLSARF